MNIEQEARTAWVQHKSNQRDQAISAVKAAIERLLLPTMKPNEILAPDWTALTWTLDEGVRLGNLRLHAAVIQDVWVLSVYSNGWRDVHALAELGAYLAGEQP